MCLKICTVHFIVDDFVTLFWYLDFVLFLLFSISQWVLIVEDLALLFWSFLVNFIVILSFLLLFLFVLILKR